MKNKKKNEKLIACARAAHGHQTCEAMQKQERKRSEMNATQHVRKNCIFLIILLM